MNEQQALAKMIAPGTKRPGKYRSGVIQVHVTRACDKACFGCTQGSNFSGRPSYISPDNFAAACESLRDYWGTIGVFGGNPAVHPNFGVLCEILRGLFPKEQCGLWCNNPLTQAKAAAMRLTFNPRVSNLNVHLDATAFRNFKEWWPESAPFGLDTDSRHSPPWVAMQDVLPDAGDRWALIADCDINRNWSAMVAEFRGEPRAWFCEIAGAQSILHQDEPDYPDTGLDPSVFYHLITAPADQAGRVYGPREGLPAGISAVLKPWWDLPMTAYGAQVRYHCHACGVPLRGYGALAQSADPQDLEQVSRTHAGAATPKRRERGVQFVTELTQLGRGRLSKFTDYVGNARK